MAFSVMNLWKKIMKKRDIFKSWETKYSFFNTYPQIDCFTDTGYTSKKLD